MKVLIGSGWWSTQKEERTNLVGDDFIRSASFFDLWLESINRQSIDADIFITDSNSPIKPEYDFTNNEKIKFVSLNENGGHAINHKGFFCGWTRSAIMSMTYCMCGDYDYYVYVEQDALLSGKIIKKAIEEASNKGAAFGYSKQTGYQLQISFFVVKQSHIKNFLSKLYSIEKLDSQISPENKFTLALSKLNLFPLSSIFSFSDRVTAKLFKIINRFSFLRNYDYLSFGYGRERPINFEDEIFYFQHGSKQEIEDYLEIQSKNT